MNIDNIQDGKIELFTPVQFLKGVGPGRGAALAELGIETAEHLLEYFPRDWVFLPEPMHIGDLRAKDTACVVGVIEQTDYQPYRKIPFFEAVIADDSGMLRVLWFRGKYLINQLEPGMVILCNGKITKYKHVLQMTNPKFVKLEGEHANRGPEAFSGPVYPASGKIPSWQIKKIIQANIKKLSGLVHEHFSPEFLKKNELIDRSTAYAMIHQPADEGQVKVATRRLKYDELFLMQLGLAVRRYHTRHTNPALPMQWSQTIDQRIRRRFPFFLTEDQEKVIMDIIKDMAVPIPMNRLLQGDVGSGKTVVALYAALIAVANKTQVAIMAPTEILARQHMQSIGRFLDGSKVTLELVVGGITGAKRVEVLERIKSGAVNIVVGTVALLQGDIDFANLGLVVIDEQHKFGVHQRATLRKSQAPHCLVMTATPIPRTLAMTAFGDLDVSVIQHRPSGRGEVVTRWVQPHDRNSAMDFIRHRLKAKKQAYFVYPRIDADNDLDRDTSDLKAATEEYKVLGERIFPEFNIALLHGQMSADEKKRIMDDFRSGKTDVLVSTVVIEVGVDVPNATMMVIENANRFGLAQLHQLRGRIGRGQSKSYCFLFAETEDETAISRLDIMTRSHNGFEIAEHDLKLRGPGELFSTRQHGLPDLKIASIIDDFDLLNLARRDAFEIVKKDPVLTDPAHRHIREALIKKFGGKIGLVDIG